MRLETITINPREREKEETKVKRSLGRMAQDSVECKFVCVQNPVDRMAVVFRVTESHSTVASGFNSGAGDEILGGGWVEFQRYDAEGKEVPLNISRIYFDSDTLQKTYGTDRPADPAEAATLLGEIKDALEAVLEI